MCIRDSSTTRLHGNSACRFSNPEFRVLRAEGDFVAAADFPGNFFRPLWTAKDVVQRTRRGFAHHPREGMGMGATASGPTGAKDEYVVTYCRVRV